jgi:hypothetical protein
MISRWFMPDRGIQIRPLNGLIELMKNVLAFCPILNATGAQIFYTLTPDTKTCSGASAFPYRRSIAFQEVRKAAETSAEYFS